MAKPQTITYQAVAKYCHELTKEGVKPTARNLREKFGGSFSTLQEHLQSWRDKERLAQTVEDDLSDELKQALLVEFSRVTAEVKEKLTQSLKEKDEQIAEMQDLLSDSENKISTLENDLTDSRDNAQRKLTQFERKIAALEREVELTKDREEKLQKKIEELTEKCHQAELKAAIAETMVAEYSKAGNKKS